MIDKKIETISKWLTQNKCKNILHALSLCMVATAFLSLFIATILDKNEINYNISTVNRMILFIITIPILILSFYLNNDKFLHDKKKLYVWAVGFITGFLYISFPNLLFLKRDFYIIGLSVIFSYHLYILYIEFISIRIENAIWPRYFLIVSAGIFVVSPLFVNKYINYESRYSSAHFSDIYGAKIVQKGSRYIIIPYSHRQHALLSRNLKGSDLMDAILIEEESIKIPFDNYNVLCALGDYHEGNTNFYFRGIRECELEFKKSSLDYRTIAERIPFTDDFNSRNLYEFIKQLGGNFIIYEDKNQLREYLNITMIRGAFFHHYQSVVRSLYNGYSLVKVYSNQYGFGALTLIWLVSKAGDLRLFDAAYLSIIVSSLIVYICILMSFENIKRADTRVLTGFILSIAVTLFTSSVMAPLLFYARTLPYVLLIIELYKMAIKKQSLPSLWPVANIRMIFLVSACLVYSFEYSILTLAAVMIFYILRRRVLPLIFIILSLMLLISAKVILSEKGVVDVNYIDYLSGVGMGGGINGIVIFCGLLIICLNFELILNKWKEEYGPYGLMLLLTLMYFIKPLWNGSINHLGGTMLMLSCCFSIRKLYFQNSDVLLKMHSFFVFASILYISSISFTFSLNKKFDNESYARSFISNVFEMPVDYTKVISELQDNIRDGDLVISPIDNAISLYYSRMITHPYPDFSTNLNSNSDVYIAYKSILSSNKFDRVIVDKLVEERIDFNHAFMLNASSGQYIKNIDHMSRLQNILKESFSRKCGETYSFVIYCSN